MHALRSMGKDNMLEDHGLCSDEVFGLAAQTQVDVLSVFESWLDVSGTRAIQPLGLLINPDC